MYNTLSYFMNSQFSFSYFFHTYVAHFQLLCVLFAEVCSAFKTGMRCIDAYAKDCLNPQDRKMLEDHVAGARYTFHFLCDDAGFQSGISVVVVVVVVVVVFVPVRDAVVVVVLVVVVFVPVRNVVVAVVVAVEVIVAVVPVPVRDVLLTVVLVVVVFPPVPVRDVVVVVVLILPQKFQSIIHTAIRYLICF